MKLIISKFVFVAAIILATVSQPVESATTEEWRRDVEAIVNEVLAIHPKPFGKIGETLWRRKAESLLKDLPQLNEAERVVAIMRLIALIGDGHTQIDIDNQEFAIWYPIRLYDFSDGYFITSAHRSVRDLAGAEVLTIAGRPVNEVIDAVRSLMGADNQFDAKERLYAVHSAFLMQGLGFANTDGILEIKVKLRNGSIVDRRLKPQPTSEGFYPEGVPIFEWHYASEVYGMPFDKGDDWIAAYKNLPSSSFGTLDTSRPPFLQQRSARTRIALPDDDAYYIQLNQTDDSRMVGYVAEALEEVDALRPKRLIIDIRYNFGGDGSTTNELIHHFIRREKDRPWEELYLITGRKSYSAAMAVIDVFLEHTDVTLIGEPAGAALNSYGDPIVKLYPAIGLRLNISTVEHQLSQSNDLRSFVPVDVPALMSFAEYSAGRDQAVDPILAGEEMRSIPTVALSEGGAAARRVHLQREKKFKELDWYIPPEEIALRRVVDELTKQGRHEDAVETAKLTTEIHPYVWNSWYNLAKAQNAAGPPHSEQRFASYKCVVLLAPTNWNVPGILRLFASNNIDPEPAPGCPIEE